MDIVIMQKNRSPQICRVYLGLPIIGRAQAQTNFDRNDRRGALGHYVYTPGETEIKDFSCCGLLCLLVKDAGRP
jgi:hypothetical protein